MKLNWKPTPSDIQWAKAHVNRVREGGIWACPAAARIYQISHANKTLTVKAEMGDKDAPADLLEEANEIHERNQKCFAAIGWTVIG